MIDHSIQYIVRKDNNVLIFILSLIIWKYSMSVIVSLILQIKKMFVKADRDGDGKLSKEEWFRVLNSTGYPTSMWVGCLVMEMHSWAGTGDTSWHLHCPTLNTGVNIQSSFKFKLFVKNQMELSSILPQTKLITKYLDIDSVVF